MSNLFNDLEKIAESNGVKSKKIKAASHNIYTEKAFTDWGEREGIDFKSLNGEEKLSFIKHSRSKIRDFVIHSFVEPIANCKDKKEFTKRYADFSDLFGKIYLESTPTFKVFGLISNDIKLDIIERAKKAVQTYNK